MSKFDPRGGLPIKNLGKSLRCDTSFEGLGWTRQNQLSNISFTTLIKIAAQKGKWLKSNFPPPPN